MKYRVVGPHAVCDTPPGELVDLSHMTAGQVAALVEAGHVREERQKEKVEASDQDKKETS
ncbi:MAG TPA: hypothetical protein VF377_10510 [Acidimicrobiia bacterium]